LHHPSLAPKVHQRCGDVSLQQLEGGLSKGEKHASQVPIISSWVLSYVLEVDAEILVHNNLKGALTTVRKFTSQIP
jgi:hypothetical protein